MLHKWSKPRVHIPIGRTNPIELTDRSIECHDLIFFATPELSLFLGLTPLLLGAVSRSSDRVRTQTGTLGVGENVELYAKTGPKGIWSRTFEKEHFYPFFCTNCKNHSLYRTNFRKSLYTISNNPILLPFCQIFARSALYVHQVKNFTWSKSVCECVCLCVCLSVCHAFLDKNHALKVN